MTGALGSTFIAAKYWDSFAIGGALVGIPSSSAKTWWASTRASEIKNGKITKPRN